MSIVLDTSSVAATPGAPTTSWTHGGAASLPFGVAFVFSMADSGFSGATYGGVSMVALLDITFDGGTSHMGVFYLINPPAGSQTVTVTKSGGSGIQIPGFCATFSGVSAFKTTDTLADASGVTNISDTIIPVHQGSTILEFDGARDPLNSGTVTFTSNNGQTYLNKAISNYWVLQGVTKACSDLSELTLGFSIDSGYSGGIILIEMVDANSVSDPSNFLIMS